MTAKVEHMPPEYGPPNPPPLTPRQMAQRRFRMAVTQALRASDPASLEKAVDEAAKALLKGLRPDQPYGD
jgi:hypothetical protein